MRTHFPILYRIAFKTYITFYLASISSNNCHISLTLLHLLRTSGLAPNSLTCVLFYSRTVERCTIYFTVYQYHPTCFVGRNAL